MSFYQDKNEAGNSPTGSEACGLCNPVAVKWAGYYMGNPAHGYTPGYMTDWKMYEDKAECDKRLAPSGEYYCARQVWIYDRPPDLMARTLPEITACLESRLYDAIAIARDRASHSGSTDRIKKWDDTLDQLRAALARPAANGAAGQKCGS